MLNSLERKIGWLAIPGLPLYIVSAQGLIFIWSLMNPGFVDLLWLDPSAVLYGREYWRLLTFVFIPPEINAFFQFFFLYFLYICGNALEEIMGVFAFTLYYLVGITMTAIGALFLGGFGAPVYFNLSIFLAFATLNPNYQILFMFIIPMKIKWLGIIFALFAVRDFVVSAPPVRITIAIAVMTYVLFFGKIYWQAITSYVRRKKYQGKFD